MKMYGGACQWKWLKYNWSKHLKKIENVSVSGYFRIVILVKSIYENGRGGWRLDRVEQARNIRNYCIDIILGAFECGTNSTLNWCKCVCRLTSILLSNNLATVEMNVGYLTVLDDNFVCASR